MSFFAHPEKPLPEEHIKQLNELLERRINGEPIAYITGTKEFWSLPLSVAPGVLVPRPDTETLVDTALALFPQLPSGHIVELGTGSGAIALALAQELGNQNIIAVERNNLALGIAAANIQRHGMGCVQLIQSSWLDALEENSACMVISNPPYLASDDEHLPSLTHEPYNALVSGKTGLEDLEAIIEDTCRVGKSGAVLLLEHGYEQGAAVRTLLSNYNYQKIQTDRDLPGHERVSYGYLMKEKRA